MAWHGLTQVVQAIREGFKFEFDKQPVSVNGVIVPGWFWLCGSDDKQLIGEPQYSSYSVISNVRFWELINGVLSGTGAIVQSIGTFGGRTKRYASIAIGAEWERFKIGNREFQNLLNIQDAVDGSMPLIAKGSNVCVVCANTFAMSLNEGSEFKLSLRHTRNMPDKLEGFEKAIDAYRGITALYKRLLQEAETVNVAEDTAQAAYIGYLVQSANLFDTKANTVTAKPSTRLVNTADRMTELFRVGKGSNGRNALDLISGATDYFTHESSGDSDDRWKQVTSSEIGSASQAKSRFLTALRTEDYSFNRNGLRDLVLVGQKALALK
jgi:hypothetical protein